MKRLFKLLGSLVLVAALQLPCLGNVEDNPARLAFENAAFELRLPSFSGGFENNLWHSENINLDLTDPTVKEEFLGLLEDGIFKSNLDLSTKLTLNIRRFKLQVRPWFSATTTLMPGIPELIFNGYEADHTYQINDSELNLLAALAFDLSYGQPLFKHENSALGLGLTVHYLYGLALGQGKIVNSSLTSDAWGQTDFQLEVDSYSGALIETPGFSGRGILADLGLVYNWDRFQGGAMVKNFACVPLTWTGVEHQTLQVDGSITGGASGPEFTEPETTKTSVTNATVTTLIPLEYSAYATYQLFSSLKLHLGYEQGMDDAWGISSTPKISTGLSWEPWKIFYFSGIISKQGEQLGLDAAFQLHLWALWFGVEGGVTGKTINQSTGARGSAFVALHF